MFFHQNDFTCCSHFITQSLRLKIFDLITTTGSSQLVLTVFVEWSAVTCKPVRLFLTTRWQKRST